MALEVLQGGRALPVTLPLLFAADAFAWGWLHARRLTEFALGICEAVKETNSNRTSENMTTEKFLGKWSAFRTANYSPVKRLHTRLALWLI
jgi:hypothetical protein